MLVLLFSPLDNSGNFRRFKSFLIFFRIFSFSDEQWILIDEKRGLGKCYSIFVIFYHMGFLPGPHNTGKPPIPPSRDKL